MLKCICLRGVRAALPAVLLATLIPLNSLAASWRYVPSPTSIYSQRQAIAAQVLTEVNRFRARYGLPALHLEPRLTWAAQSHSNFMALTRTMSHTGRSGTQPWDRVEQSGYAWHRVAENVAAGQHSPQEVVNDWIHSPGHRANMLDPQVTEIGVGYTNDYWTLDLARP